MSKLVFDTRRIVRDFGGMTKTSRLLTEFGWPTSRDAVDKWRRRHSLPVGTLCRLAFIAKERKQRFDLYDYIILETDETANGRRQKKRNHCN